MSVTTKRKHNASPLPFMGQKRNFSKKFIEEIEQLNDDYIFVDLFGGSGLLSHLVKQVKPNCKVVCNDYDNFAERLKSIHITNQIIDFSRPLLADLKKGDKIPDAAKEKILQFISSVESSGQFVDFITLSSQYLFSGAYVQNFTDLSKDSWYNKLRKAEINADGYLEGVEIVSMDYLDLFNQYKRNPKVIFIADPPYLQTQSIAYKSFWNLADHLDSLQILEHPIWFYFTSSKSSIIEFFDWLDRNGIKKSPFRKCKRVSHKQNVNYNSSYEDIMFVKK